jgi:hypothetical protein
MNPYSSLCCLIEIYMSDTFALITLIQKYQDNTADSELYLFFNIFFKYFDFTSLKPLPFNT